MRENQEKTLVSLTRRLRTREETHWPAVIRHEAIPLTTTKQKLSLDYSVNVVDDDRPHSQDSGGPGDHVATCSMPFNAQCGMESPKEGKLLKLAATHNQAT